MGRDHGRGYRSCTGHAAREGERQVGAAQFPDISGLGQRVECVRLQSHMDLSVHDGDCGGHGASASDILFDQLRCLDVLRVWHAVGDDRRFQRHDGPARQRAPRRPLSSM